MKPLHGDGAVAWAMLFEHDPEFARLDSGQAKARQEALLAAWYAHEGDGEPFGEVAGLEPFAREWIAAIPGQDAAVLRQAAAIIGRRWGGLGTVIALLGERAAALELHAEEVAGRG